jgi:hypothetical protein
MGVIYGVVSYLLMAALLVAYFLIKRWGDKEEEEASKESILE